MLHMFISDLCRNHFTFARGNYAFPVNANKMARIWDDLVHWSIPDSNAVRNWEKTRVMLSNEDARKRGPQLRMRRQSQTDHSTKRGRVWRYVERGGGQSSSCWVHARNFLPDFRMIRTSRSEPTPVLGYSDIQNDMFVLKEAGSGWQHARPTLNMTQSFQKKHTYFWNVFSFSNIRLTLALAFQSTNGWYNGQMQNTGIITEWWGYPKCWLIVDVDCHLTSVGSGPLTIFPTNFTGKNMKFKFGQQTLTTLTTSQLEWSTQPKNITNERRAGTERKSPTLSEKGVALPWAWPQSGPALNDRAHPSLVLKISCEKEA